jgi:hypothetical protein
MGSVVVIPRHEIDERVIDAWSKLMQATAVASGQTYESYAPWKKNSSNAALIARDVKYGEKPMEFRVVPGGRLDAPKGLNNSYPLTCYQRMVSDLKRHGTNEEAQKRLNLAPTRIRYLDEDPLPREELTFETAPRNKDGQTRLVFG